MFSMRECQVTSVINITKFKQKWVSKQIYKFHEGYVNINQCILLTCSAPISEIGLHFDKLFIIFDTKDL